MPKMTILVGPPGSGKSTLAKEMVAQDAANGIETVYVNQDSQGKGGHMDRFREAGLAGKNIIVDRMNFNRQQRANYLTHAKIHGYQTKIIVLHESHATCFGRMLVRQGHETIKDEENARGALKTFFGMYERPQPDEADEIEFRYPSGTKPRAIICDLDGTLCDVEHRRHFVRREGKKDWVGFFKGMKDDLVNYWCADLLERFRGDGITNGAKIVMCSGRPDSYETDTRLWLGTHQIQFDDLFMRKRYDSRQDDIIKEIILDFEILTRYVPYFMIDDRQQVVDMWRKRGYVCLQCDKGDF